MVGCISRYLKEELAWTTHKQLQVMSNIMLFKTVIPIKNYRIEPFKVIKILYVVLYGP